MATKPTVFLVLGTLVLLAGQVDAAIVGIVDNLPGAFTDISVTGQPLNLSGDQEVIVNTVIGNGVLPTGPLVVGTNGGLAFSPIVSDLQAVNQPLPSAGAFNGVQALLAFWDDIDDPKDPPIGDVFFEEQGNVAIIQWDNVAFVDLASPGGGVSATIGYQDGGAGNNDAQFSFDAAGAVSDGTVLSLIDTQTTTVLAQFIYQDIVQTGVRVVPRGTFQIKIFTPEPSAAAMLLSGIVVAMAGRRRGLRHHGC